MNVSDPNSTPDANAARIAGDVFADLINDQLDEERKVKTSLEQRGLAVTTAAVTLSTLILALVGAHLIDLSPHALGRRALLVAAIVMFMFSALLGVLNNRPARGSVMSAAGLNEMVEADTWNRPEPRERRRVYEAKVRMINDSRRSNRAKARLLNIAMASEVIAMSLVAASVTWQLMS